MTKHLTEEEFIDLLFEEGQTTGHEHLSQCRACQEKMDTISAGLNGVQAAKARSDLPQNVVPIGIQYKSMARRAWKGKLVLAVAACFVALSVLGFRFQVQPQGGFELEFSVLGLLQDKAGEDQFLAQQEQLAKLEQKLMEALETQTAVVQANLNDQLEEFSFQRANEWAEFSRQVESNLNLVDEQNAVQMASFKKDVNLLIESRRIQ